MDVGPALPGILTALAGLVIALGGLWGQVSRNSPENVRRLKKDLKSLADEAAEARGDAADANRRALLSEGRLFRMQLLAVQHGWMDAEELENPELAPAPQPPAPPAIDGPPAVTS